MYNIDGVTTEVVVIAPSISGAIDDTLSAIRGRKPTRDNISGEYWFEDGGYSNADRIEFNKLSEVDRKAISRG